MKKILFVLALFVLTLPISASAATIQCQEGLPYECYGTGSDDTIHGSSVYDEIFAEGGDDWVQAHSGNDYVFGNAGADILYGASGHDEIYGGGGRDTLNGGCPSTCTAGSNYLNGGNHDDTIYAENNFADVVNGGDGFDTCRVDQSLDGWSECEVIL